MYFMMFMVVFFHVLYVKRLAYPRIPMLSTEYSKSVSIV